MVFKKIKREHIKKIPQYLLLGLVYGYRYTLSPLLGLQKCRFIPSCSNYALESLKQHGALKGGILAAKRIGDFTPFIGTGRYQFEAAKPNLTPGPFAPAALKVQLNYLNQSYIGTEDSSRDVNSDGVRWDFAKNLALKLQYEMAKMKYPAIGANGFYSYETSLLGKPSGFDGKVSMLTVNLDFVF